MNSEENVVVLCFHRGTCSLSTERKTFATGALLQVAKPLRESRDGIASIGHLCPSSPRKTIGKRTQLNLYR